MFYKYQTSVSDGKRTKVRYCRGLKCLFLRRESPHSTEQLYLLKSMSTLTFMSMTPGGPYQHSYSKVDVIIETLRNNSGAARFG